MAPRVKRSLNDYGYAFYGPNAPSPSSQALLHAHRNWPVFFITPEMFSGSFCGRLDAAFVFKLSGELQEATSLERLMATEGCKISYDVFPATEDGLRHAAEHYGTVKHSLPFRI